MRGGVDTTVLAAFAVGFVSFISPSVLPLVPGYLSAVSGVSLTEIKDRERSTWRILLPAIVFCASFTVVFVVLGVLSAEEIDANSRTCQQQALKSLDRELTEVRFNSAWLAMPSAELFALVRRFTGARLL